MMTKNENFCTIGLVCGGPSSRPGMPNVDVFVIRNVPMKIATYFLMIFGNCPSYDNSVIATYI